MGSVSPPLHILCFGASITGGHYQFGLAFHPYSRRLRQRLQQSFPSSEPSIHVNALPGDYVLNGKYMARLRPQLARDTPRPYDWIIVQGGGNDLIVGAKPGQVFDALKKIWRTALDSGAKVLALTVTETSDRSDQTSARYKALNDLIIGHQEENFYVADVCSAIPWPKEKAEVHKIWDDGLHFTPFGYDMLGDAIANKLVQSSSSLPLAKM
ncbi:uncharacterized protein KY384_004342 [Bacidia gigantensis]|uniref:uncharacterized protein n=1 Tax=Bacidia gigantensis TaxID=2732470 RepID=UPI001D03D260|nr:uncharacterized protein KY384_004342 [Bacidia gigantensis]KAG8530985.1 hypothetical protein KY384_004342 [Bacidia gigantensis]